MESNSISLSAKWIYIVIGAALIVACLIAYAPVMRAGFIWDDDAYVTENPLLSAKDGLKRIWFSFDQPSQYFPMTYTVFRLEYKLWGLNPAGYHLVNIFIHITNAFLVWLVLSKLRIPGAWLAAGIFALHPVNVESVAWVTELKNILMAFFSLLSILAWLQFIKRPAAEIKGRLLYALSLTLYALALLSKTTACTLPVVMLLILWFKKVPTLKRHLRLIIPYVALAAVMGFVTIWWEHVRGEGGMVLKLNYLERILLAGRALLFYIGKLILPVNLTFSYPLWNIDWTKPLHYTWILTVAFVAALIWYYRAKIGRGPIAAVLFFAATLTPVLGFISLYTFYYSYVADHYVYIAYIGLIALFAAAVSTVWHKAATTMRNVISFCLTASLIMLCVLTWRQGHIYKDIETLWQDTLKKNPNSLLAHANMGVLEDNRGNIEQAIRHYYRAIEIYPDDFVMHYNLGNIFKSQGKFEEAVVYYLKAIQFKPNYASAHNNLANTLKIQGKIDEAIEHYKTALTLEPRDAKTHYNLANTLRDQGRLDEAVTFYERAIEIAPQFDSARTNLAITLESMGRTNEAIIQYRSVLQIDPNSLTALVAMSDILTRNADPNIKDANASVKYAERAAELTNYNDPAVLKTLVMACAAAGDRKNAEITAQKAIDLANAQGDNTLADLIRKWLEQYKQPN
ncbi:MAG: tetratricopeptide repeat protein [Phycisphaerae bacterium]|jgi:tetratricopeptide (TPR) repeat protein